MYQLSNAILRKNHKRHKKMFTNIAQPEEFYNKVKGIKSLKLAELTAINSLSITEKAVAIAKLGKRKIGYMERLENEAKKELQRLLLNMTLAGTRSTITRYRNYIKSQNPEHAILYFFKLPRELNDNLNANYKKKLKKQVSNLTPISKAEIENLIQVAVRDLQSDYYTRLCLALCLLTGRRPTELLLTASMQTTDKPNEVTFKGQAKEGEIKKGGYNIPVLHCPDKICKALAKLKSIAPVHDLNVKQGETLQSALNRRSSKTLAAAARRNYNVKPHELRALYAEYCTLTLKPSKSSTNSFIADILGHNEEISAQLIATKNSL